MSTHVSDAVLKRVLTDERVFAVVGAGNNRARPSYGVMANLLGKGFTVIPINPGLAGGTLLGQTVYATLADVPRPVDVVDIFRNSKAAGDAAREAITQRQRLCIKTIWMQLGVINDEAATQAEAAGFTVIMDHCPKIEYARLMG